MKPGLLFFVLAAALLAGCSRETPLAVVGGEKILPAEFAGRYAKYLENTGNRDNILVREQILNNMINERAILADAHRRGFDSDTVFQRKLAEVTGQALLDGYARSVSTDTIEVTQKELWDEFRASNSKASARYVYAATEAGARKLRERLERGETFETLAREVFTDPRLADHGGSVGFVARGDMERNFDDAAFSLPVGVLSEPVRLRAGWAIIRVDKRVEMPLASEADYAKKIPALKSAMRERKTVALIKKVADEIAVDLQPKFNEDAVDVLLAAWGTLGGEEGTSSHLEAGGPLSEDRSHELLVTFRDFRWTVGDVAERATQLPPKYYRRVQAAVDLKDVVIGLATREILLDRARRAGLERSDVVRRQIKDQRALFLLRRWEQFVTDTVSAAAVGDSEIVAYYAQNREMFVSPPEVNVGEILVKHRTEADSLLRLLRRGADFADLARRNSIRPWAAEQGGELGYGPRSRFGPYADKFFRAKVGDLIGPETVEPFVAVFTILGKKEVHPKSLEESRADIVNQFLPAKKRAAYEAALGNLRKASGVSINMEALGNVVVP
jgi:parvulin-like peptidyl-prolyl isomerase